MAHAGFAAVPVTGDMNRGIIRIANLYTSAGIPLTSSGVFTSFYNNQPGFKHDRYIAVIGTLGTVSLPRRPTCQVSALLSASLDWNLFEQFFNSCIRAYHS
jgi:hypothetical protein